MQKLPQEIVSAIRQDMIYVQVLKCIGTETKVLDAMMDEVVANSFALGCDVETFFGLLTQVIPFMREKLDSAGVKSGMTEEEAFKLLREKEGI